MFSIILFAIAVATIEEDSGDSAPANQQAEHRAEVSRVASAKVSRMKTAVGNEQPVAADLRPKSLLRWSNPTVAEVYGEVFAWTVGGRPVALGSVYHAYDRPWGWTLELDGTTVQKWDKLVTPMTNRRAPCTTTFPHALGPARHAARCLVLPDSSKLHRASRTVHIDALLGAALENDLLERYP